MIIAHITGIPHHPEEISVLQQVWPAIVAGLGCIAALLFRRKK
jgi:hypothetical protein